MNTKGARVFLLLLALIIWTWVGVRIYKVSKAGVIVHSSSVEVKLNEKSDSNSRHLSLDINYPDPFYYPPNTLQLSKPKPKLKQDKPVLSKIVRNQRWPDIEYKGIIRSNQNRILFIELENKIILLKSPYIIDSLTFTNSNNYSTEVRLGKELKIFNVE